MRIHVINLHTSTCARGTILFGPERAVIKDILGVERNFAALSTKDLLDARDQYHWHLIHKKNVVGTAIGLYYIRTKDDWPSESRHVSLSKTQLPRPKKGPRTFDNSEVRDYSPPCV